MLPSQILLSLGLYLLLPSSALAASLESSTRFHRLAILLVTFLLGWGRAGLGVMGAGFTTVGLCVRGAGEGALRRAGARRLSMSLLLGTRLGSAVDPSAADRSEWEEEEVRRERREVREVTEEAEEVDERGPVFLEREASRRACVLLGRGATVGRGAGAGLTVSRLSRGGLLGRREGGVRLEGREEPLAVLLEEELEDVSVSSLVKVPCLTRPGSCLGDLGERGVLREGEVVRALGREEREELLGLSDLGAGASFLRLVWLCLSWVARVPLIFSLGDVCGEDEGRGREVRAGLGATGGGTVARFMGGE